VNGSGTYLISRRLNAADVDTCGCGS